MDWLGFCLSRRRIGDRAFSVAAPRAWNRLPTELKLLRSTDSFRRDLKTFLCFILSTGTRIRIDSVMRPQVFRGAQYKCLSYSYSYTTGTDQITRNFFRAVRIPMCCYIRHIRAAETRPRKLRSAEVIRLLIDADKRSPQSQPLQHVGCN